MASDGFRWLHDFMHGEPALRANFFVVRVASSLPPTASPYAFGDDDGRLTSLCPPTPTISHDLTRSPTISHDLTRSHTISHDLLRQAWDGSGTALQPPPPNSGLYDHGSGLYARDGAGDDEATTEAESAQNDARTPGVSRRHAELDERWRCADLPMLSP